MKKRVVSMLLAALAATTVLTGCSGGNNQSSDSASAEGDTVSLKFWGDWTGEGEDWMNTMIDAFEAENPGIQIEYVPQPELIDTLVTSIAGGTTPDILFWDRYLTNTYASEGFLYDIDDLVAENNVDLNTMVPGGIEEMTVDGNLYGLPIIVDTRVFAYNVNDFEAAGITKVPETWDEFLADADAVTAVTGKPFTATDIQAMYPAMLQAGGYPVNDAGELQYNTDAGKAAANFYKTMLDKDQMLIQDQDLVTAFAQGNVSVIPVVPGDIRGINDFVGEGVKVGYFAPPAGPNGDKGAQLGGYALAIPAASKNAEAAFKFIDWWATNADNSKIFCDLSGELPANVELLESDAYTGTEDMAAFAEALMYARPRPAETWWDEVSEKVIKPTLELFYEDKLTVDELVAKIDEDGNALIATLG